MIKFKDMSKCDKIYRIFNYTFSALMFFSALIYNIVSWGKSEVDFYIKIQALGPLLVISAIYLVELVFRFRVSNSVLLFYNIYVFFASYLGTVFHFYANITFYDDIMHTLFGYVGCVAGLYLVIKLSKYEDLTLPFTMLILFSISMCCEAVWEIIEYGCDTYLGSHCQGFPVNGIIDIKDTMGDICNNFFGALVFEIHYLIHRLTKKKLLIGNIVEEFSNK